VRRRKKKELCLIRLGRLEEEKDCINTNRDMEGTGPIAVSTVWDGVEDCLFYEEGQGKEGICFCVSDYFSAYGVLLGNYCAF
jgi:hypothetical protein